MNRHGFTIVELIVVMTIIGILVTLATVSLNAGRVQSRDAERAADVEAIAAHLESFYKTGTTGTTTFGRYPTTGLATSFATIQSTLRDIDQKSLTAPGISDPLATFIAATNNTQTIIGVTPQPTISQYVYQPIKSDGTLCTGTVSAVDCRKFNLYYHSEADSTIHMITSKNQ